MKSVLVFPGEQSILLDVLLIYAILATVICVLWPRYLTSEDGSRPRAFGVSDKSDRGVFAGVMPFTVAAILATFVPLTTSFVLTQKRT